MRKKGYIFPLVIFFVMIMFIAISFGFLILNSTVLSHYKENISHKIMLESLLRTQFAGKNSLDLEEEILNIVLKKNQSYTYSYEPKFVMEPFPVEGSLRFWKDDTKGSLTLKTKEYEMESLFSFWFSEITKEEPYLVFEDASKDFQNKWMETKDNPIKVPPIMESTIINIPSGKEMYLRQNGESWNLYEVQWDHEKEAKKEFLVQRIKNHLIYIHNLGDLTVEGQGILKGGVINKGILDIQNELSVEGIWWELGNTMGYPKIKGKVFLQDSSFSGEAQYDYLSLFRYGRYIKALYHLEPINFKITPHDYFSQRDL